MEHRPQRLIRISLIESCRHLPRQVYSETPVFVRPFLKDASPQLWFVFAVNYRPADPVPPSFRSKGFIALARPPELRSVVQPFSDLRKVMGRRFDTTIR